MFLNPNCRELRGSTRIFCDKASSCTVTLYQKYLKLPFVQLSSKSYICVIYVQRTTDMIPQNPKMIQLPNKRFNAWLRIFPTPSKPVKMLWAEHNWRPIHSLNTLTSRSSESVERSVREPRCYMRKKTGADWPTTYTQWTDKRALHGTKTNLILQKTEHSALQSNSKRHQQSYPEMERKCC